ncbi:Oxygen tolerance [Reichenbachiella agariperforans]|uniref:Oxygen tolerance n=1 Tax=Reichenbachiella agariperforans TaxID=156994 RepID=A0A1M6PRJ8_REIAG|nr:BatD family protein [Reichenbachiella agariperforans]SHK10488.1 Oxygen tolerance [Reichenbachiella agariperforans]
MRPSGKGNIVGVLLLCMISTTGLHAQKLWSQVQLNRSSVYVGEPVEVSITVYTSTWFTDGLDLGNIQVDGAYTVYFRPVSVSMYDAGTTYPGIQLIYHVFPYEEQDIVFPSLTLEVETPKEGDYIGVRRRLKTKERIIKVRPVPPGFDKADWMVATGMYVSDHWSGKLNEVKVGEVFERKITRTVYGTVAELIPPVGWDSTAKVSMYPDRTVTHNNRGKTSISSSRTERMRYLFEKEGTVTIPEMVYTYFNPYKKRLFKRTLKAVTIEVQPNPDLGVLKSVRDSLLVQQQKEVAAEEEEQPWMILGMTPEQFAVVVLFLGVIAYFFIKLLVKIYRSLKHKRAIYLQSEAYYFDQVKKSIRRGSRQSVMQALYRWIDELELREPSVGAFVKQYGTLSLHKEWETWQNEKTPKSRLTFKLWQEARDRRNKSYQVEKPTAISINP